MGISKYMKPMGGTHLRAAILFAENAVVSEQKAENAAGRAQKGQLATEARYYTSATVFSSVSAIEATMNELFIYATDSPGILAGEVRDASTGEILQDPRLPIPVVNRLASSWRHGVPQGARFSLLEKANMALLLADSDIFSKGHAPAQDIDYLTQVRNFLIHYEPKFRTVGPGSETKLEQKLLTRFKKSANQPRQFPEWILCASCAEWAVQSANQFLSAFFDRLGIYRFPGLGGLLTDSTVWRVELEDYESR